MMCMRAAGLGNQLVWVGGAARTERRRVGKGSGTGNEGSWRQRQVMLVMWHC